ncbi:MAG: hypothetical protein AAF617_08280, partial [Bacteroidota bacterium]
MNFHYYLIFLCLFFVGTIFSQEIDSLTPLDYQTLKSKYREVAYANPQKAKNYLDALIQKASNEKNPIEKYNAFLLKSSSESDFGNMQTSLQFIDSTIAYANASKNNRLYINALSQKGRTYYAFGKYDEAIQYYLQIDSVGRKTNNIRYQIYSNHNIGITKNVLGDHQGAVELHLKNKELLTPIVERENYQTPYLNMLIGLISAYTNFDIDKAANYLPELKSWSLKNNDTSALTYYYTFQGIVAFMHENYDTALNELHIADSLATSLGAKRNFYDIYRFRGKSYYKKQKFSKAIDEFESIKKLQKEIEFDDFDLKEAFSLLASSYEQLERPKKALENYRLAHKLSYTDTIKKNIRNTISNEYDKKTLEDKIKTLENNSTQKAIQNTSLWLISGGLLIAFLILLWIYKKQQRDNQQKFDALVQKLAADTSKKEIAETNAKYQISDEKITKILDGLAKFEQSKAFLKQNTSLVTVAKKLNTNTTYLSQIINEQKGVTFKNYITELRITYVL